MIDTNAVEEIIRQYEKHGWKLRRALLSPSSTGAASSFDAATDVHESDLDALWFSRRSRPDVEAWELRRLTGTPFALVTLIPTDFTDQETDAALNEIERDMRERTIA